MELHSVFDSTNISKTLRQPVPITEDESNKLYMLKGS